MRRRIVRPLAAFAFFALVAGCGGGDDGGPATPDGGSPADTADTATPPDATPDTTPDVAAPDAAPDATLPDLPAPDAPQSDVAVPDTPGPDAALPDQVGDTAAPDALADAGGDAAGPEVTIHPELWTVGEVLATYSNGLLARLQTENGPVDVLRLEGDHVEMGYQYGRLVGQAVVDLWWTFMHSLAAELPDVVETPEQADQLLGFFLDQAWAKMEGHVAPRFLEEYDAISAGAEDAGVDCNCGAPRGVGQLMQRMVTILEVSQTRAFGALGDDPEVAMRFLQDGRSQELADYYATGKKSAALPEIEPPRRGAGRDLAVMAQCSFFALWGNRTVDGHMLASRVLDWSSDTGIAAYKLVTVYVPREGHPYATIGYHGCPMAGISEEGLAVGMVGSSSVLERIDAASGLLKMREVLEVATSLQDAYAYLTNDVGDGLNRPNSIGANVVAVWGDPRGGGAAAEAVAMEMNGAMTSAFYGQPYPDCSADALWIEFDEEGWLRQTVTNADDPTRANLEADAHEIDIDGNIRTFQVDEFGDFVLVDGQYVDDPAGQPLRTGYPLPCALFRGDEALGYGTRRYQEAANGPQRQNGSVMVQSGSYRGRYMPMHDMVLAYEHGTAYDGETVDIPDNGGLQVPIGLTEGTAIASEAAMDSNIMSVVYDATALEFAVAYESGSGETWLPGSMNPYVYFRLNDLTHPW